MAPYSLLAVRDLSGIWVGLEWDTATGTREIILHHQLHSTLVSCDVVTCRSLILLYYY